MLLNTGSSPERRESARQQGWLAAVLNQGWGPTSDRIPSDQAGQTALAFCNSHRYRHSTPLRWRERLLAGEILRA